MHDPHGHEPAAGSAGRGARAVIVLGMHRSGTSCLAGSLQQAGLHLGEVQESNPHNRRGNREKLEIMRLNDAVLARSGGAWNQPPATLAWTPDDAAARDDIVASLERATDGAWGFKDPRTLLTLPFWRERLPAARLVGSFRHPAQVARSLHARSGFAPEAAFALWTAYNARLLREHARSPFPLVSFDRSPDEYRHRVEAIVAGLGLRGAPAGGSWFETALRSADDAESFRAPDDALRLHDALEQAAAHAG